MTQNVDDSGEREARNAVFAAREAAERGMAVSRDDLLKRDFGLDIPVSAVPIPSLGKVYPEGHPLHLQETVDIRSMTTREEDILMSPALHRKGTVISELIKSCMVTPGVDVTSLISGDRNALMVAVRILGYGSDYQGNVDCPKCEHKNSMNIDLNSLNVKELVVNPSEAGQNKFTFTLPVSKKDVVFKLLTGKDEEEILATFEVKKKKGIQNQSVVTTRLMYSVLSIAGITDKSKISMFVSNMPAIDSMRLRKYMDEVEPGIDMKFEFTCASCGHTEVMPIPLGPEFFWPGRQST